MPRRTSTPRKAPARQLDIVNELRREIVRGLLAPGSQFPLRVELEQRFGASRVTVQRAIDLLREEGFVYVKGRQATYVSDDPPHLTRHALVFPQMAPADGVKAAPWFWEALAHEAGRIEQECNLRLRAHHDVDARAQTEPYQALVAAVRNHQLAGLIFPIGTGPYLGTPLLDYPRTPRVAIADPGAPGGVAVVTLDARSMVARALDHFAARGRRRVAVLTVTGAVAGHFGDISAALAGRGLTTRACWSHEVNLATPHTARTLVHLIMCACHGERPDALLITDDNLVGPATEGLVAAGCRVPEDLDVVGHCNFPWPTPAHVPVRRIGYDANRCLRLCLESLAAQRRGEACPDRTLPALFECELGGGAMPPSPGAGA